MLLVRFELYVQLDERRAGSVLEVNDARVDDSDRLEGSEVRGLPRQREVRGELGRRYGRGRRTFGERNDRVLREGYLDDASSANVW